MVYSDPYIHLSVADSHINYDLPSIADIPKLSHYWWSSADHLFNLIPSLY